MYDKAEYEKNKKYYREYMKYWLVGRKLKAIAYKGGQCQSCGYNKCYSALEFHHRDPSTKEFDWFRLKNRAWSTIVAELNKCDLLCSNCHREKHSDDQLMVDATKWLESHSRPPRGYQHGTCPQCNQPFERTRKTRFNIHCSAECRLRSFRKVDYPPDDEFIKMVNDTSKVSVAKVFGVSEAAIRKRLKKLMTLKSSAA